MTYIVGSRLLILHTTQMATHSKEIIIISTTAGTNTARNNATPELGTGTTEETVIGKQH